MVATNRQCVAVAGHHEHREIWTRDRESGSDRWRPAVDRVHAVSLEVVRESRRATDTGDEHDVLASQAQFGQERLHRSQNRVVAAARAPANFLVGLVFLRDLRAVGDWHEIEPVPVPVTQVGSHFPTTLVGARSPIVAAMTSASSTALNGMPLTLSYETASIRNFARISSAS